MNTRVLVILAGLSACTGTPNQHPGPTGPDPNSPRVLEGLQVLYTFDEGDGLVVHDRSGVEPAFDLQLDNLVTNQWLPDGGVQLAGPSVITSLEVAEKVFVSCVQANAVTVEMWIEPDNITQNGTIFTYSKQNDRNVTLAVDTTRYNGSVRTSDPNDPLMEADRIDTVQTVENTAAVAAQHVVYTRNPTKSTIYVDGNVALPVNDNPPTEPPPSTDQNGWNPADQLAFGNETNGGRPWLGKIYLAAVYCRDLTAAEVQKNFGAGF
ncbi:MAG: LamG-like jellyroll fold domain-containing protein [Kofleriaceae bacterium]